MTKGSAVQDRPDTGTYLALIDLRPAIARGDHPIGQVLAAVESLAPTGVLELVAPFEPRPMLERLRALDCEVSATHMPDGSWIVRIARGSLPPLDDLSDLAAPEPLERALAQCTGLAAGAVYCARLPRTPAMLLAQLDARGLEWRALERPDGSAVIWVRGRTA